MPAIKGAKQDKATIAELKEKYIWYFRDAPIQKYAAQYIHRNEQTIIEWKNTDEHFANLVKEAEGDFVRKNLLKTKADWKLERMFKKEFGANLDITSGGEKIIPILSGLSTVDENKQD
jgi:hypothetical protein